MNIVTFYGGPWDGATAQDPGLVTYRVAMKYPPEGNYFHIYAWRQTMSRIGYFYEGVMACV